MRDAQDIALQVIYEELPVVWIDDSQLTMNGIRLAESLFEHLTTAPSFKRSKLQTKWEYWQRVYHALCRASHADGCVAYDRGNHKMPKANLQVIDAAAELGLVLNIRSRPGSSKCSRLLALLPLEQHFSTDPWEFDAERPKQFVFLRDRDEKTELPFDPTEPIPAEFQKRLETINAVNSAFEITYSPFDAWSDRHIGERRLRPVHYAVFTEDFEHHGRLYTGKYGHQSLRSNERQWIRFNGLPSIELDFSGMHPRMCYHLRGIDFRSDPYALWGDDTTDPLRLIAKRLINAALNAKSENDTIRACNCELNPKTESGEWKTGKAGNRSRMLRAAIKESGLSFKKLYPVMLTHHQQIADAFGSDAGMKLMNIDGRIALQILDYFTSAGVPCLGVHDSFIVPAIFEAELRAAMRHFYYKSLGFCPSIK